MTMHLDFWGATDIGCVRLRNEDYYLVDPLLGLALIADGIGGQHRGDIASALACRVVREHLRLFHRDLDGLRQSLLPREAIEDRLREGVQMANGEIFRAGLALSQGKGMGCTLDAVLVVGNTAFIAHVGDSRVYLRRGDRFSRVTTDHTVAQEKVRRGLISQEAAEVAPDRGILTRSVGGLPTCRVDTRFFPVQSGDCFVLCTDGVTRHITDGEIDRVAVSMADHANRGISLRAGGAPPDKPPVESLIHLARDRGGYDNITAVALTVSDRPPRELPTTPVEIDELRATGLFESATTRELQLVCAIAERRFLAANEIIAHETDACAELCLLRHGRVETSRRGRVLEVLGHGALFGEAAFFDSPGRRVTVRVVEDSLLIVLARHRLDQLMRQDDALATRILWGLLRRAYG